MKMRGFPDFIAFRSVIQSWKRHNTSSTSPFWYCFLICTVLILSGTETLTSDLSSTSVILVTGYLPFEPQHDKTNKMTCAQQRLRSAWASIQSDQRLRCPPGEGLDPSLPTERTAKTLIRLGGCPGWSESSLGAQVILLVLSCCCSFGR